VAALEELIAQAAARELEVSELVIVQVAVLEPEVSQVPIVQAEPEAPAAAVARPVVRVCVQVAERTRYRRTAAGAGQIALVIAASRPAQGSARVAALLAVVAADPPVPPVLAEDPAWAAADSAVAAAAPVAVDAEAAVAVEDERPFD
jgi:hypothetical protein